MCQRIGQLDRDGVAGLSGVFEQAAAHNFVVKVIYLPDPQYQDLAATGPDEVVSSRLEPGVDPIVEAKRRGSILAIIRLGNCFDLLDPRNVKILKGYHDDMIAKFERAGIEVPRNYRHHRSLDCAVFNYAIY